MPAAIASWMDPSLTGFPSTVTVPLVAGRTPNRASAISVRPEPSRPVTPRISPSRTEKLTSSKAPGRVEPLDVEYDRSVRRELADEAFLADLAPGHGFADRLPGEVGCRPGDHLAAGAQDRDPLRDAQDLVELVGDEHQPDAARP